MIQINFFPVIFVTIALLSDSKNTQNESGHPKSSIKVENGVRFEHEFETRLKDLFLEYNINITLNKHPSELKNKV